MSMISCTRSIMMKVPSSSGASTLDSASEYVVLYSAGVSAANVGTCYAVEPTFVTHGSRLPLAQGLLAARGVADALHFTLSAQVRTRRPK